MITARHHYPADPSVRIAPWTEEEVGNLVRRQEAMHLHPYNCACGALLMATDDGWICFTGCRAYTQDWCHASDARGEWPPPYDWEEHRNLRLKQQATMIGPGRYDDILTATRQLFDASGGLLILLDGSRGHGCSCQVSAADMPLIVGLLREVADNLERDINEASPPA